MLVSKSLFAFSLIKSRNICRKKWWETKDCVFSVFIFQLHFTFTPQFKFCKVFSFGGYQFFAFSDVNPLKTLLINGTAGCFLPPSKAAGCFVEEQ